LTAEETTIHLKKEVNRLIARGVLVSGRVGRGATAAVMVEIAREVNADLVVIATLRLAGLSAFWADAVARKVTAAHSCTLLLAPFEKPKNQGR
jgi:nucleotide-binding universal stress UspA family protein